MENLPAPVQLKRLITRKARCATQLRHQSKTGFSAAHRAAKVDPRAMLSFDSNVDYRPSLRVVRRFCGIVLFFACWATVRHWPYPINYLSNMLKVAFVVCIAFALLRNERFADVNLNYWDEGLAYVAIALFLDFFGAR
jgi:hypothetical protein